MVVFWIIIIFQAIICASLSSHLAKQKGHQSTPWGFVGFFFGILGLIAAAGLPLKSLPEEKQLEMECPDCISTISARASICKYCGREFSQADIFSGLVENLHKGTVQQQIEAMEILNDMNSSSVMPDVLTFIEKATPPAYPHEIKPLKLAVDYSVKHSTQEVHDKFISILKETTHDPKIELLINALVNMQNPSSIPYFLSLHNTKYHYTVNHALIEFGEAALPFLEKQKEDGSKSKQRLVSEIIEQIKAKQVKA